MFMAKRKKSTKKKKTAKKAQLPSGFWAQVFAVFLIVLAIFNVVAWFRAGGFTVDYLQAINLRFFGYGVFIIPITLVYLAVEIFRDEENKLPLSSYISSFLLVVLFASLFGLIIEDSEVAPAGLFGDGLNYLTTSMLANDLVILTYTVLIIITILFLLRVSPFAVFSQIKKWLTNSTKTVDGFKPAKTKTSSNQVKFELNKGVPIVTDEEKLPDVVEKAPTKKFRTVNNSINNKPKTAEAPKTALVSVHDPNWKTPPLKFLSSKQSPADAGNVKHNAEIIKNTLHEFNIDVEMTGANIGPKVTQYTLTPPSGVKLTKIAALENNIALNLAAESLRIEAPIPGKSAVGIDVPNVKAADVRLRSILESNAWRSNEDKLSFVIGRDISGKEVIEDLATMPHLLIAGQTGSGKSVMINTLLASLLYRNSPSDLKLILVDPKQVEMAPYEDIPHLIAPIITEPTKTISALKWAVNEMERRYRLLASEKKKDIKSYNQYITNQSKTVEMEDEQGNLQQHHEGAMPYIVIVIDEMADLMMVAQRDVETLISRIAAKARAVGIHLVLATQRPSVNVVTGLIKANVPARIGFTVASQVDSRTILDQIGAEKLLGKGDMLITTTKITKPRRIQGALVTEEEIVKITDYLRMQMPPQYNDEIVNQQVGSGAGGASISGSGSDDLTIRAIEALLASKKASTGLLQRKLRIGYNKAALIMDELEERGVVSQQDASKRRELLITSMDDLNQ